MTQVWYHGSREPQEELEAANPTYSGSLGGGVYLTSDPNHAMHYGSYIHEVFEPVPEDEVLWLDQTFHYCGDDMVMGTPGAQPFTFDVTDRKTGKTFRYSVLEACEESVRADMAREMDILDDEAFEVAAEEASQLSPAIGKWTKAHFAEMFDDFLEDPYDSNWGTVVEHAIQDAELENLAEQTEAGIDVLDELEDILLAIDPETLVEERMQEHLGDVVDLYDLAGIAEQHGYSAVYSHHAPSGDELVIFDDRYLPVEVEAVAKNRAP